MNEQNQFDYQALYLSLFGDITKTLKHLESRRWEENPSLLAASLDQAVSDLRLAQQKAEALYCGEE